MIWNYWIVGIFLIFTAVMALKKLKAWEEWLGIFLGIWLVLSPWILGYWVDIGFLWNSLIVGVAVTVLSAIGLTEAMRLRQQQL